MACSSASAACCCANPSSVASTSCFLWEWYALISVFILSLIRSYLSLASSSLREDSFSLCSASESFSSFAPGVALSFASAFFLLSTLCFLSWSLCRAALLSAITVLTDLTCLEYSFMGSTNSRSSLVIAGSTVSSWQSLSATFTNSSLAGEASSSFSLSLLRVSPKVCAALKSFLCLVASLSLCA